MDAALTIPKRPRRVKGADYAYLRRKGIEHVQNLGHRMWTDYNTHDPGVTILEALCYALTDVVYRTEHPIEDLLAEPSAFESSGPSTFFSAREILSSHPVTLLDYRKLLIDVAGIRNAWLATTAATTPEIYLDERNSRLSWSQLYGIDGQQLAAVPEETLPERVRQQLRGIPGRLFERAAFLESLAAVLSDEELLLYQDRILALARVHRHYRPRGLYSIRLEFEADPVLGDLNQLAVDSETLDETPLPFRVHVENAWARFRAHDVAPSAALGTRVEAVEYDAQTDLYTSHLVFEYDQGIDIPIELRLTHSGRRLTTDRERLLLALRQLKQSLVLLIQAKVGRALELVERVMVRVAENRNLCEDFLSIEAVETEDVVVCVDVEVESTADIHQVAAEIEIRIEQALGPSPKFYTLSEMLDRAMPAAELFSGPPLDHGFLDDDELAASELRTELYASDLIAAIMDVPGVTAVRDFEFARLFHGELLNSGERWRLPLSGKRRARLETSLSRLRFYKDLVPYAPDPEHVHRQRRHLTALARGERLAREAQDFPIPRGSVRDVCRYYSVQHLFPSVFGVGAEGLGLNASDEERAAAKQLKSYLRFFDQLLADYLSQLGNLSRLFSLDPQLKRTYFGQPLYPLPGMFTNEEVPRVQTSERRFVEQAGTDVDWEHKESYRSQWEAYLLSVKQEWEDAVSNGDRLRESQTRFEERRNRILDHLLARFAEQFTDYVLLMHELDRRKAQDELIRDKCTFLSEYPRLSAARGRAANVAPGRAPLESGNTSGFQHRVCRLLGIDDPTLRRLVNGGATDDELDEGFHVLEHILLRPRSEGEPLMSIATEQGCMACPGFTDPYSFRLTVVAPAWPSRFQNMDFRRFTEKTLREEAPAHVHVKICWVAREAMAQFEDAYFDWLEQVSSNRAETPSLTSARALLVERLCELRSVYPPSRLGQEREVDDGAPPVLLNHSVLGSTQGGEHD